MLRNWEFRNWELRNCEIDNSGKETCVEFEFCWGFGPLADFNVLIKRENATLELQVV